MVGSIDWHPYDVLVLDDQACEGFCDHEEQQRRDELGEIFESLDSLSGFLPSSMENWQMPSFVVLGSESSGKSTLLERVSMFRMFPCGDGICTRMAIKVEEWF